MISMNIKNMDDLAWNEDIKYCLDFFQKHDMENYPAGRYATDKDYISLRIDEYETQIAQERYWQAHKNHIDIYILINGTKGKRSKRQERQRTSPILPGFLSKLNMGVNALPPYPRQVDRSTGACGGNRLSLKPR